MANGDTYRAGANEQIEEHAEALDTKIITHQQGGDPAAVIYDAVEYADANGIDVVLGDTAGRLHTSNDLMAQLEKIDRVVDPDMTLFVDEAVAGQDATNRAKEFNDAAEIDGGDLDRPRHRQADPLSRDRTGVRRPRTVRSRRDRRSPPPRRGARGVIGANASNGANGHRRYP